MSDRLNDILAAIDAETAKCICGRPVPANGPSLDYCSLPCQYRYTAGLVGSTQDYDTLAPSSDSTTDGRTINAQAARGLATPAAAAIGDYGCDAMRHPGATPPQQSTERAPSEGQMRRFVGFGSGGASYTLSFHASAEPVRASAYHNQPPPGHLTEAEWQAWGRRSDRESRDRRMAQLALLVPDETDRREYVDIARGNLSLAVDIARTSATLPACRRMLELRIPPAQIPRYAEQWTRGTAPDGRRQLTVAMVDEHTVRSTRVGIAVPTGLTPAERAELRARLRELMPTREQRTEYLRIAGGHLGLAARIFQSKATIEACQRMQEAGLPASAIPLCARQIADAARAEGTEVDAVTAEMVDAYREARVSTLGRFASSLAFRYPAVAVQGRAMDFQAALAREWEESMRNLAAATTLTAEELSRALGEMYRGRRTPEPPVTGEEFRRRALEHRQNRGTGPAERRQRFPRDHQR